MTINLKECPECNRHLVSLGFRYYSHPPLKDHFDRTKDAAYQCSHVGNVIRIPR